MSSKLLCDPYLWESPLTVLYTPIFPTEYTRCVSDRLNHIILVFILFLALGAATAWKLDSHTPITIAALLSLVVSGQSMIVILRILLQRMEGFQGSGSTSSDSFTSAVDVIGKKNTGIQSLPAECIGEKRAPYECNTKETTPIARNPFMNVLIDELKYNPTRPAAASVLDPTVRLDLDEFFKTEFYADPTDVFGRSQGQRQWVTMPSTSIPNDIDSYQNWLYRIPGKTCKEGGECLPGTDGAAIPWLNDSTFTFDGSSGSSPGMSERERLRQKLTASQKAATVNRYPAPYVGSEYGSNSADQDSSLKQKAAALEAAQKYAI